MDDSNTATSQTHEANLQTVEAALSYLRRGWYSVPLIGKNPSCNGSGWQNLRLTETEIPTRFVNGSNLGLLNGAPSAGLADVDKDCDEAVALARAYLPETGAGFGRGGRQTHDIYITTSADFPTTQFRDPSF